jgi:soluble lytic murein transglycosylase
MMTPDVPKTNKRSPFASAAYDLRSSTDKTKASPWKMVAGVLVITGLLVLLANADTLFQMPWKNWIPGIGGDSGATAFVAQNDLNREQAENLYRQAVLNLQNGEFQTALDQFKKLEPAYPILKDMLWLRQAECYAGLGNEWAVQKKLNTLISQLSDSPMKTLALYRIGQSQFRGREWEKADETFTRIRRDKPESSYAAGSLYYLGALLANKPKTQPQAIQLLRIYLKDYANGKFGVEAATLLERLQTEPSALDHAYMGLAYAASSNDARKALAHLRLAPIALTWHAIGHLQIHAGQTDAGVQTLASGLSYAKDADDFSQGLDAILAVVKTEKKVPLLKALANKHYPVGGDYALWKLAEADEPSAEAAYRQLVSLYPRGEYAPESLWRLIWPLIPQNRLSDYLIQAQHYMAQYGYSRSAPKVMFWMGKAQEKIDVNVATQTYTRLEDRYPGTYYAFRAEARLKAITEGANDPGWRIKLPEKAYYNATNTNLNTLDILPSAETFGTKNGEQRREEAEGLQHIGLAEDTSLFVTEAIGSLPATVESWAAQITGDRARGIRAMRTALDKRTRQLLESEEQTAFEEAAASSPDEMKLLYPIYFAEWIEPAARRNGLDPYLVQALMREESYFNEFAVSGSNARGLMQLLPATAADVAHWEQLPDFKTADLFTPQINIHLGSRYLAYIRGLFNGNAMPAVGAYNGGPGAMRRWVTTDAKQFATDPDLFIERIPYGQSRDYIKKVFAGYWNYQRLYGH